MPKTSYLPPTDGDLLRWFKHFTDQLPAVKTALGLSDEELAKVGAVNQKLDDKFAGADHAAALAKQATTDKTAAREEALTLVRPLVQRIKATPGYNPSIGTLLGIEGAERKVDPTTLKPVLTVLDLGTGKTQLSFRKGPSTGVKIFSKRETETEFTCLDRCSVSPYIDSRPLLVAGKAEIRKYKVIYLHGDAEIGQFSDQVNTICSP
ncbi:hypothetical protein [uncultured Thiodictyon sp.]|uniref:hypothetical protein n=1 Tax=uncultured Thiodictyon sp. TaxID=1846217 RepID=UPI0025F18EC7|nr:hypothetical protein [uncultured Thiodictyon sp.]